MPPAGSRAGEGGVAGYVRAIESLWASTIDRAFVLSPRDWTTAVAWYEDGVPLEIVGEALREATARRGGEGPRGLAYLAPAVGESWRTVLEGRRRREEPPARPVADPLPDWRACAGSLRPDSPLAAALRELLARLDAGAAPSAIDRELDAALPALAGERLLAAVEHEVDRRLAPFRERMSDETLGRTRAVAVVDALRRRLGLGRVAARRNPR